MSDAFELEICHGKYRYRYEAGKQEVWRNGDTWPAKNKNLIGDKFVFSLAVELDEALKERDALRAKIEAMERQVPHSYIYRYWNPLDGSPVWRHEPENWNGQQPGACAPLYALPGAKGE